MTPIGEKRATGKCIIISGRALALPVFQQYVHNYEKVNRIYIFCIYLFSK
jgi:hypothetical protein